MSKDFVKRVAQAYAEGSPKLHEIAEEVLREIDAERGQLAIQASTIRQLLALKPKPKTVVVKVGGVATGTERPATRVVIIGRLSDELKDRVRTLWQETYDRTGDDMTAQQVITALKLEGITFPVANPVASVGTVIGPIRKAAGIGSNGQDAE